jgi:hypothetical protein
MTIFTVRLCLSGLPSLLYNTCVKLGMGSGGHCPQLTQ